MIEPRFDFDINVLVSAALFPGSVPSRAIDFGTDRGRLLITVPIVEEIDEILRRPKSLAYLQTLKWVAQVKEKVR